MTEQRKEGRREEKRKERKEGKTYDSRITSEGRKEEEEKAKMNESYVKDDVRFPVKEEKETSEIGKKEKKKG